MAISRTQHSQTAPSVPGAAAAAPIAPTRRKTAFVFAGGGSLGSVQVGMLRALVAHGETADLVVGSSVGALNGAHYAGSPNRDGVERLRAIWLELRREDVFPVSMRSFLSFMWRRDYLVPADGVRQLVETHLPFANLEDASVPLHIVATDLLSGEPVILSSGPAAPAIVASAAIPAAFAPVMLNGHYLADGAITSNTPVSIAVALGAQRLIVLPTGYGCALRHPPRGAIASALHALTLLIAGQLLHEIGTLPADIEFCVAPPLCPLDCSPYDFSKSAELIERATDSTTDWIAGGGLKRREIPHQMELHKHH
jgi:NTE family protein